MTKNKVKPTAKKIYTLNDFKTGKIAIHTPTQRAYNKLMQRFEKAGFDIEKMKKSYFNNSFCPWTFEEGNIFPNIFYSVEQKALGFAGKDIDFFTYVKPHQLNFIEETPKAETEKQIQSGWTDEMIEEAKKNPEKYGLTVTSAEELINKLIKKEMKYTIEDLKTKKIAVNVKDWEEYLILLGFFVANRLNLSAGHFLNSRMLNDGRTDLCIYIDLQGEINSRAIEHCRPAGFKVITLDQLEGLEPTAERYIVSVTKEEIEYDNKLQERIAKEIEEADYSKPTAEEGLPEVKNSNGKCFFSYLDGVAEISLDFETVNTIKVKYQGKEKVITREDFEDRENKDSGYAEGSDMWAFKMVLEDKKVFNTKLPRYKYLGFTKDKILLWRCVYNDYSEGIGEVPEDGWKLYKEPKQTMTLREAIEQGKTVIILDGKEYFKENLDDIVEIIKD